MKKIGVVVPIFNAEPYLETCVKSILDQTYTNLEVVLVDDGSNDRSGEICHQFEKKDSRVHVIRQSNQGKLLARYHGIKALKSEYATFVDADDWLDINAYEKIKLYCEEDIDVISYQIIRYFNEDYSFVSNNYYSSGKYMQGDIRKLIFPTMIWDNVKKRCGLDPSLANKVVKRDLLLKSLHNAKHLNISYGDDVAVTYPLMLYARTLMIIDESLYYHRKRNENETAPYFADRNYYRKLSDLYDYLIQAMGEEYQFIKQLDYFYESSVKLYLKKYGDKAEQLSYLFPFHKIPKGKRIVLYGASKVGQTYYEQIKRIRYGEITAWIDRAYASYEKLGVKAVESILKIEEYDYVVIAIKAFDTAEKVKRDLIGMGVEKEKIVWSV